MRILLLALLLALSVPASASTLTDCLFAPLNKWVICPAEATDVSVANITGNGADVSITSSEAITAENPAYFIVHDTSTAYDNYDSRLMRVQGRKCDGTAPGSGEGTNTVTCTVNDLPEGETFSVTAQHFFKFRDGFIRELGSPFATTGTQGVMPSCSDVDIATAIAGASLENFSSSPQFNDIPALSAAQNKEFHETGVVRLDWYSPARDGVTNDWAVIDSAARDAHDYGGTLHLGSGGTLGVDRTVDFYRVNNGSANCATGGSNHRNNMVVIGDSANEPTIKLLASTFVDFSNASAPRDVVRLWNQSGNDATCTVGTAIDVNGETRYEVPLNGFRLAVYNFKIDTGGHDGARGLSAPLAQQSHVVGIDVIADGSHSCFGEMPGRLGGAWDMTCSGDGALYGYKATGVSQAFYDSSFIGPFQTAVFMTDGRMPATLAGIYVEQDVAIAPVIKGDPAGINLSSANGSWDVQDMEIVLTGASATTGGAVFENDDDNGRSWSIERVFISGAGVGRPMITSNGETDNFTSAVQSIDEFVHAHGDGTVIDRDQGTKRFYDESPTTMLIDGVTSTTTVKTFGTTAAPANIRKRHQFELDSAPLPMYDNAGVLNTLQNSCVSNRGNVDTTAQLQAVLDEYCEVFPIFIPKGTYAVSGELTMSANCRVFGVNQSSTAFYQRETWQPTTPKVFFRTVSSASGTARLSNMTLWRDPNNAGLPVGDFYWNVGSKSRISAVNNKNNPVSKTHPLRDTIMAEYGPNAGGITRLYSTLGRGGMSRDSRPFIIGNTNGNPLMFHGTNPEHVISDQYIDIDGAVNLKFISNKEECGETWMSIKNSDNVRVSGFGNGCSTSAGLWPIEVINSTNVRMTSLLPIYFTLGKSEPNFFREVIGATTIKVDGPTSVTLYSRGTFDNSPFESGAFQ